jgi:ABC-type Na+ efflux pump permease subunit
MPADLTGWAQLFEAGMLICFGISWPASIRKTLRAKRVEGKSLAFLGMIFSGYLAGIAAKLLLAAEAGTWPQAVTLLYAVNAAMVAADIGLYLHYRRHPGGRGARLPDSDKD